LTALLLESELTSDQEESLVSVKECADLLLHIINSVLDLAKIEAGRLEVEKVPFNIRKMVSSTFRMLQARAQQRGLQLLWEVEKSVPQTLVGDVGKLQQCLMNLGACTTFSPSVVISSQHCITDAQLCIFVENWVSP
jgi:signal transduction histidine kinase